MEDKKEVILTQEGFENLEKELEYLKTEKRAEISERIKIALGFGDLSENSEYDEAKNAQAENEALISELENKVRYAKIIDESEIDTKTVQVGNVVKVLDLVGLKNKAKHYPTQLSGGEQQRVAIARAIVNGPKLLICDEPTGNLDPKKSMEIMEVLEAINKLGTTVVMVTHDIEIVKQMNKRVILLNSGRIVKDYEEGTYKWKH